MGFAPRPNRHMCAKGLDGSNNVLSDASLNNAPSPRYCTLRASSGVTTGLSLRGQVVSFSTSSLGSLVTNGLRRTCSTPEPHHDACMSDMLEERVDTFVDKMNIYLKAEAGVPFPERVRRSRERVEWVSSIIKDTEPGVLLRKAEDVMEMSRQRADNKKKALLDECRGVFEKVDMKADGIVRAVENACLAYKGKRAEGQRALELIERGK